MRKKAAAKSAKSGQANASNATGKPAGKKSGRNATVKKAKAGPRGQRGSDNAAHIRDVSLNLFAKKSFSAVTIKEIGEAAGLNTAMIYYYFRDKEDLFRDTVETAVQRSIAAFEARRADDAEPEAVITKWLETHIEQLDLIRKFLKISVDYAGSDTRVARIDNAIKRFYEDEHAILAAAIREGRKQGIFVETDVDELIELTSTYLDGVMVRSLIAPGFDAKAAIHGLQDYVLRRLKGV